MVESAKYTAWKQLGSISPMEAMRLYVRTVEEEQVGALSTSFKLSKSTALSRALRFKSHCKLHLNQVTL